MKRIKIAGGVLSGLLPLTALADWEVNMTQGATDLSQEIYGLHMIAFWVCVGIGIVVFGAMIYSIMHHRKDKGHKAATFHESTTAEIVWTIIPVILVWGSNRSDCTIGIRHRPYGCPGAGGTKRPELRGRL